MKKNTKLTLLVIVILLVYGSAVYSWLNPPVIISPGDQLKVESILEEGCPQLMPEYEDSLDGNRQLNEDKAIFLLRKCTAEMKKIVEQTDETTNDLITEEMRSELFYRALVKEFARNR